MIVSGYKIEPGAYLRGAYLAGANLAARDLKGADLRGAHLYGSSLAGADLVGANLAKVALQHVDLRNADLTDANLSQVNLRYAYLRGTKFHNANLKEANLDKTCLIGASFDGANLSGTCLDPNSPVPECDLSEFERQGEFVIGYRTQRSQHVGAIEYEPGEEFRAPWFSTSSRDCHPGLYFATLEWLHNYAYTKPGYPNFGLVQVMALASEVHRAGGKFRAKRLWVMS
jgi:hypothetical protein